MRYCAFILLFFLSPAVYAGKKPAAKTPTRKVFTTTPVYDSIIAAYRRLDAQSDMAKMFEGDYTDAGKKLSLFVLSKDGDFSIPEIKRKGKVVVMINNGIHPGEPDGIDASIELAKTYIAHPELLPNNVVLCIIPVYNIDGCMNRGSCSRANQCGPEQYGFRGNAENLDLNRDFIKADARNTMALEEIFQAWQPDIFIDTHVSDGADYQYTMTLIATQRNKLQPLLANYMDNDLVPALYDSMNAIKKSMCPYVETFGETPETGITGFLETPRFSTGYAALFNCIGFVTETHMLKPYNDRVWATYDLLQIMVKKAGADGAKIIALHKKADEQVAMQRIFTLNWKLDTTQYSWFDFKGYEAAHKTSEVTGMPRLYYDHKKPYTKKIKFFNTYVPATTVTAPDIYIIPFAYHEVATRLMMNYVFMKQLSKDTMIRVPMYYIDDYQTGKTPYESHYLHHDVKVKVDTQYVMFHANDYVVPVKQPANRYIVETLEPEGGDSFFAWNFFDGILQQKEWFSDYVFEEKADSLLKADPNLKAQLDAQRKSDTAFAKNSWAQLNFVYQRSPYKEVTHNRYPVGRIFGELDLPVKPATRD